MGVALSRLTALCCLRVKHAPAVGTSWLPAPLLELSFKPDCEGYAAMSAVRHDLAHLTVLTALSMRGVQPDDVLPSQLRALSTFGVCRCAAPCRSSLLDVVLLACGRCRHLTLRPCPSIALEARGWRKWVAASARRQARL